MVLYVWRFLQRHTSACLSTRVILSHAPPILTDPMPHDLRELLRRGLDNLPSTFEEGELAYLALTCKPEGVIRDRLAFWLHRELSDSGLIVSREWAPSRSRVDLAVLSSGSPLALVELKAMYNFDVQKRLDVRHDYHTLVRRDIEKALGFAGLETEVYALLLSTHPHAPVDPSLDRVVKYLPYINRSHRKAGSHEAIREAAAGYVGEWFPDADAYTGTITGGNAFGIGVDIDYWLVGPYFRGRNG